MANLFLYACLLLFVYHVDLLQTQWTRLIPFPHSQCHCLILRFSFLIPFHRVFLLDSTSGDSWKDKTGWLSGAPDCEWDFVTCHEGQYLKGKLSAIRTPSNNLIGELPDEISAFNHIEVLDLYDNKLKGTIPKAVSKLTKLETFDVEDNSLSGNPFGSATSLVSLNKMKQLRLSGNEFNGQIPSTIGKFQNLKELWIGDNAFKGTIPSEIGNLTALGKWANTLQQ